VSDSHSEFIAAAVVPRDDHQGASLARAEAIQDRTVSLRNTALDALMALIADIKAAKEGGAGDEELKTARDCQRRGQFYVDFVESENSNGFHAPQESVRILGEAIDLFRKGQVSLRPLKTGSPTDTGGR